MDNSNDATIYLGKCSIQLNIFCKICMTCYRCEKQYYCGKKYVHNVQVSHLYLLEHAKITLYNDLNIHWKKIITFMEKKFREASFHMKLKMPPDCSPEKHRNIHLSLSNQFSGCSTTRCAQGSLGQFQYPPRNDKLQLQLNEWWPC